MAGGRCIGSVEARGPAALVVTELHACLAEAAESLTLPPDLLLGLGQQFIAARLPIHDDVRDLLVASARASQDGAPVPGPEAMAVDLAQAAEAMGHDPFLIHEQFGEQFAVFPDDTRVTAVGALAESDVPAMRDAALGWLLDPSPAVSRGVAEHIAAAAQRGLVTPASAYRLVQLRPWLPGPAQEIVDAAITSCRGQSGRPGGSPQAGEAAPAPAVRFVATACDGGGAQSVFAFVDGAERHDLVAVLTKHGHGVRETVLQDDVDPEESAMFLEGMAGAVDCFDTLPDFVGDLIAHSLATGLAEGEPPTFGLLQFLELTGLPSIAPARLEAGQIVAQLLDGLPAERRSEAATKAALAASKGWAKTYLFPSSWFEPDEESYAVVQTFAGAKRQGMVLAQVIEPRRAHWGALLAWIAKAARGAASPDAARVETARSSRKAAGATAAEAWIDLALVARAFLDRTPIAEIPLAAEIAKRTIALHRGG